jgi:hypothetical protein
MAVSAPVADNLWTAMLAFLMLIILGICILYAYFYFYLASSRRKKGRFVDCRCTSRRRRKHLLLSLIAGHLTTCEVNEIDLIHAIISCNII